MVALNGSQISGITEKIAVKLKQILPAARRLFGCLDPADALERYRYRRRHPTQLPIPPKPLRMLVGPDPRIDGFLDLGRRTVADLQKALGAVNRQMESFRSILDFGCGCGRQIRWLADMPKSCRLHGTDVYAPAIRWNRRHLPFAEFEANGFCPPLSYSDGKFDFIYAISVLTHLSEQHQLLWVGELSRIASPGAILIVTTQGQYGLDSIRKGWLAASDDLARRLTRRDDLSREGIVFEPYEENGAYGMAFHDTEYIRARWGRTFRVLDIILRGMDGFQDIVIMEKAV